jgi:Flp pilus assembly protein TadD
MSSTADDVKLDESELLHLAMQAMRQDRHDEATRLLKRAHEDFPQSAQALHLLGAEHAQMGLFDRAVAEMAEAVRLDPSLTTARFQLGLLYATSGRAVEAETTWQPLEQLSPEDPMRLFKSAMVHVLHDEFAQGIDCMKKGIAHNELSEPLNVDMRRLLADLEQRQAGKRSTKNGAQAKAVKIPPSMKRVTLPAYDRNSEPTSDT